MKWDQARQILRLGRARREEGGRVAASPDQRTKRGKASPATASPATGNPTKGPKSAGRGPQPVESGQSDIALHPGEVAAASKLTISGSTRGQDRTQRQDHSGSKEQAQSKGPSSRIWSRQGRRCANSICVVSGKGGTGKSLVSASLARLLSVRGRTLVVDADLGVANAHILQDVHPERSFADVIEGTASVGEIVTTCGEGLDLLAGGSGYARLAGLTSYELQMIGRGLTELETGYKYILIDSAAGLSNQTVAFAAACDVVLLVTTPDVTAMTDAYAFLKVFVRRRPMAMPLLVVNRTTSKEEAEHVAHRIQDVARKFLGREVAWIGSLPEDRAAFRCTQRRTPVAKGEPESPLGLALDDLSKELMVEISRTPPRGVGENLVEHLAASERTKD